jgi:MFS family permease
MTVSFLATNLLVLGVATLVVGACNATFYLARQSFVTLVVPASARAAAMSTLGGSHRIGLFIGPFVGAAVIHATSQRAAFLVAVGAAATTVALLLAVPEPAHAAAFAQRPRETATVATVWRQHSRLLLTLGVAVFAIGAVRAARPTVVPLWANHLGLDAQTTSLVFGIGAAVDMALFYPAGVLMDRYGRLAVAVPSMLVLGGSMMLVPLTTGVISLAAATLAMSFGNGLGSGIVMTLGADVAPSDMPVRFLSQWRMMGDSGNSSGPLLVSAVASVWSLAAAVVVGGLLGLLAAAGVARWVPRYSAFATSAMVRARAGT